MQKQAKILSDANIKAVLAHLEATRHPVRNKIIFLLSLHGLRAVEIANVTWQMVSDADRQVSTRIELDNSATKGNNGGRVIHLSTQLISLLIVFKQAVKPVSESFHVVISERGEKMSAATIANWFGRIYKDVGLTGASSHSGRRTFITLTARKIVEAGGSIRDVQALAGHKHLSVTQRYIDQDSEAQRKVIGLIYG